MLAFFRLLRPSNIPLSFGAVLLGAILATGVEIFEPEHRIPLLLAMLSAALVGSASNAQNDVFDLEIDRRNRPERPVASGAISTRLATITWAVLSILGIIAGAFVSIELTIVATASVGLLWLYNARLKGTPGPGNIVAAGIIALALLYGALAVSVVTPAVWAGVGLTFLLTLARELAKDIEDTVGDGAEGARTISVVLGEKRAAQITVLLLGTTVALLPVPTLLGVGRSWLAYGVFCAGCLLAAAWMLAVPRSAAQLRSQAGRAAAWLKVAMVAGIVALAAARLGI